MNTLVKDLVRTSSVVFLHTSDNAAHALSTLDKNNIISAPVVDENNKIWGFLDVLDLVMYVVKVAEKPKHSNVTPNSTKLTTDDLGMIATRSAEFNTAPLSEVMADGLDLSNRNPYYPLHEAQTVKQAIEIFLKGPHRIALTNDQNQIVHILTQCDIISWLAKDTTVLGLRAETTAEELMRPVVSVSSSTLSIDAFKKMATLNLTSIAVVDDEVITGVLSATDLKNIKEYRFLNLLEPVTNYIYEVRKQHNQRGDYVVVCDPKAALKDVIRRLAHSHVHRIFVVDTEKRPLGVISLTDIISYCFA